MKNKIAKLLKHDKLIHFFVGFFIYIGFDLFTSDWEAFFAVAVLAFVNEAIDYKKRKVFDYVDILFTIAPSLILILLQ